MKIGLNGGAFVASVDEAVAHLAQAAKDGFSSYWLAQFTGLDALTLLAVGAREAPGIELGTSIVPIYPRHPMALASQAITVQQAIGGRLALGIGASHRRFVEGLWGYSFERSLAYTREYVTILRALLHGEDVDVNGEHVSAHGKTTIANVPAPPVLLAALAPGMLAAAGALADGTITWMVGPKTLRSHVVPRLREAAESAGRPTPRLVVGLVVCVTSEPDRARGEAKKKLGLYGELPSYAAMLDREGVSSPEELMIAGSEEHVTAALEEIAECGATDVRLTELCPTPEDGARTRALLAAIARARGAPRARRETDRPDA